MAAPIMHQVSAKEEYAKNPDLKKEDVTALQAWVQTQMHLPTVSEEMLIQFHHSCYFDLEKTKDCIETYYTIRTIASEFFSNRDLTQESLASSFAVCNVAVLPKTDKNGYQLIYSSLRDCNPSKLIMSDAHKYMIMTMDMLRLTNGTMEGVVLMFDMKGTQLKHLTRFKLSSLKRFADYIQEGNPVCLKALHIINVVPFIDICMSVVKPFLKKELLSLFHFHTDVETLYKCIPKECLPKDIGGELSTIEELSDKHIIKLRELSDYFAEEEKFRIDDSKREKGNRKKQKPMDNAFANLEID